MQICFYWESLYVPLICLVVSVFRSILGQLSECGLQWFDPGFSLTGGVCCGICCVQRGLASNPSCTATHNLLWACGSQRCPGVRQFLLCFSRGKGCQRVHGWVSDELDWAFCGSVLCPMGCRLGIDVLGSWAEQRGAGFCPVSGPCRGPRQQLAAAAAQLTGKDVGGWVLEIVLCRLTELLLLIYVLLVPISGWFVQIQRPVFSL